MLNKTEKMQLIENANKTLAAMFRGKVKLKPIRLYEIEAVYSRNVLGIQADAKTKKGTGKGYLTGIMYLAPSTLSGFNLCPKASQGCKAACLFTAGRGAFYSITRARMVKTFAYLFDKPRFVETVKRSIKSLIVKAENKGLTPVVRLNGTSDIVWEQNTDIIQSFPTLQFYDYTKIAVRFRLARPANYHLTFSLSESNESDALKVLALGGNVAAVFRKELPLSLFGIPVINGDETDLRFLDVGAGTSGVIVGLKAKGKAKRDASGFVRDALAGKAA